MTPDNKFNPVPFNPREYAARRCKDDPAFRRAYEAIESEFSALEALLDARKSAGLTQAEVASRMGVSQPALARIESSLGSKAHSPSLNTLRKYAKACGMKLVISMVKEDDERYGQ